MVKNDLIDLIMACGYDFISACELAGKYLAEIKAKPSGQYTYHCKAGSVTIKKS